jgi:hypothetical protein
MSDTDEIQALLEPLARIEENLVEEIKTKRKQLETARGKQRRVRAAIKALNPAPQRARPKPKQKLGRPRGRVIRLVAEAIMDGAETNAEIGDATELSRASVGGAVRALRADEIIR